MSFDWNELIVPFSYDYMLKAMYVSALIGGVCGLLSCFITLKGWSLMGDALSHSIVPGVAIAAYAGWPYALGAFAAGILAALGMGFIKTKTRIREDAVIGIVFTAFFALGALLISMYPRAIALKTIAFGNILGIADSDMYQVAIIAVITFIVLIAKWKDLALYCFDPQQARALGLNVAALNVILLTLLSATAVAALQTVGACLVAGTLVAPGATAYLLTDRFGRMLWISAGIGIVTGFGGAYASYFLDGSTGGCIVSIQATLFVLALIFAPKHGLVAARLEAQRNHRGGWAMMHWLTAPLQHQFMVNALLVGALVAAVCAVLSCFLVLKGWSLMGDAISHAVLPGIVLAHLAGLPLAAGAFASGLFCAVATGWIKNHSRVKEDTVMGVVFTGLFGLGLVLMTKVSSETELHLNHILVGHLLGITPALIWQTVITGSITLVVVLAKHRDLLLYCFDPSQARVSGLNTTLLHYMLLVLLALTIVTALQAVGIILVIAMLITPGCVAYLLTDRFGRMMAISFASALLSCVGGVYASFYLDASAGSCIVLVQALQFVVAMIFAPKHGLIANWARGRAPQIEPALEAES